ncbi:T9SS type A sorting domain-containing protein [Chryseobacterium candidae]|uniref:T9SS type A sorting domain-containing protein n=1 Tax=Chryseobacterium candidae TaxID=1978493 RepID=A0ABY2R1V7_9FLAO|nr:T9SS type A sorting domain-containing protein [Chryseobacterium candidae]THV56141.1 T9SS type A sorting domain-containing protein [Chryseobacterium candidae]
MRKSLFAIGLLAIGYSVQAQILCHVDTNANMYVSEGTLVYSGGGVQTKGNGLLDVHGNIMVVGSGTDLLKTIDASGADKTDGGNIILRLNTPASFATSTYGQLYVDGLSQSNVTGIVSKEYRNAKHGNGDFYQQMALPFNDKVLSSLSPELNKTFSGVRYSGNAIFMWNNATVVSDTKPVATTTNVATAHGYYMLGSKNNNLDLSNPPAASGVYTINGKPYSTLATANLVNAGNGVNFGTNGNFTNSYNEKYNTYLWDQFEETNSLWAGTFGKNIYEFGNPFLTNLDLSRIGYVENGGVTDGNAISNIWGIQYSPGTVQYVAGVGSTFTNPLTMTFDVSTHIPVGDVNNLIVKPMGVFIMKLRDNTPQTLNFNTLRRFSNTARAAGTDYNVNASKSAFKTNSGTVKQLGVIGLDANGKEVARVYYVVTPNATTGHQVSNATSIQAATDNSNSLVTYEEALNGGQDPNYSGQYKLYINEANENNFLGKDIVMDNFDYGTAGQKITSYKFEIRENAELIPAGVHQLSSGIGFYYKSANGTPQEAKQGAVVPVGSKIYNLYYGEPNRGTLITKDTNNTLSKTMVVYNPTISNYIVRFDPSWKKADIEVYDMSGKLIISKKAVNTSTDFVLELDSSVKSSYVVKVVSEKGVIINTKILK